MKVRRTNLFLVGLATASIPLVTAVSCGDASFYRNEGGGDGYYYDSYYYDDWYYDDYYYVDDCYFDCY